MKAVTFAVPGSLDTPTGGYIYDRRIVEGLRAGGWDVAVLNIGDGFPNASRAQIENAHVHLAACGRTAPLVIDGLALGVMPQSAEALALSHRVIALVHHPLALETGLDAVQQDAFADSERRALAAVRHVVTTSKATAEILSAQYGVEPEAITVVEPGTDRAESAGKTKPAGPVALLSVGSVVPRKGYDILIAALAALSETDWTLTIVGDLERNIAHAQSVRAAVAAAGLENRVTFLGAIGSAALSRHYEMADIFVLPSRFEGYGMAFSEAIAHGLPVVATGAGALCDTLPPQASVIVPSDDIGLLSEALRSLIASPERRRILSENAREAAKALLNWKDAAARFAAVLEKAA